MASEIRVNKIINRSGLSTVTFTDDGAIVSGIVSATVYTGSGANLTNLPAGNLSGSLPAINAANLTNVPAANITGTLPAIDGSALTGVGVGTADSINTSGIVTATSFVPTTGQLSHRNMVVNGACNVAQRGSSSTAEGFVVDRFRTQYNGVDEAPTISQANVNSGGAYTSGFRKCYKIQNGNQTSGAGATDFVILNYKIEAQDLATSGWNYTSASGNATLSFWVKSSVSQNFYGYIRTRDGTELGYPFETGTLTADTWTKVTKTIPGNSSITFNLDTGEGVRIVISPFWGTNYTTSGKTLNTWAGWSDSSRTPDFTSTWWTTNDATFEITGLQFEVGPVATPFEHRSFGDELRRCLRYYEQSYRYGDVAGSSSNTNGNIDQCISSNSTGTAVYHLRFFEEKRTNPTVTFYRADTGTSGQWMAGRSGANSFNVVVTVDSFSTKSCRTYVSVGVNYGACFIQGHYTAEAEL